MTERLTAVLMSLATLTTVATVHAQSTNSGSDSDILQQIEDSERAGSSSSTRKLYRDGKVVGTVDRSVDEIRQHTAGDADLILEPDEFDFGIEDGEATAGSGEEFFGVPTTESGIVMTEQPIGSGSTTATGAATDTNPDGTASDEELKNAAPAAGGGMTMTIFMAGGAAILLGTGAALFFMMRRGKPATAEEAPPTAEISEQSPEAVQQKSNRLEKVLAEMDENDAGK